MELIDLFYRDMVMIPDGSAGVEVAEKFIKSVMFMKVLDKLGLIEVVHLPNGQPHNVINVCVDEVVYFEDIRLWVERFE